MKRLMIIAAALALLCTAVSAKPKTLRIEAGDLAFEVTQDASRAAFIIKGKEDAAQWDLDFWRLILDENEGIRKEVPILSTQQKGKAALKGGVLTMEYENLASEWGGTYPVRFVLEAKAEDGLLVFTPTVINKGKDFRINECQAPYAGFTVIDGPKEKDFMVLPRALGRKIVNPWKYMEDQTPNFYNHDENETVLAMPYPRSSMSWYGVQSGSKFLYVARYDANMTFCNLSIHHTIGGQDLIMGINHLPMARPGENITLPSTSIGLLEGDWRAGADRYRAYADASFFKVTKKSDWIRTMPGWQRLTFNTQYGEQHFKFSDLPKIYEIGKRYGVNTIFMFGWWKEGMDWGYPDYTEPYPGAFEELKANIKKVQEMGGHIVLECNCHFLDMDTDFYKQFGDDVKILDINGHDVRSQYGYPGRGEFRAAYGKRQFPLICTGTEKWRNQVLDQLKFLGTMVGPDCVFADCYGGCPWQPCFNHKHEHGYRVDQEGFYKMKFWKEAQAYSEGAGNVLGTEVLTDLGAAYTQFVHGGLSGHSFVINGDDFPELFRYTFPEVITTNRGVRCSKGQYDRQIKYAMLSGMRMDGETFTCRATLDKDEAYAQVIKFCADNLVRYGDFFFYGKFTCIDMTERPYYIKMAEYYNADGSKILRVLYNASYKTVAKFGGVSINPDEMRFDIFDAKEYLALHK